MKLSGFEQLDPGVRAFILITVAIAYPAWEFGFEIGAFGRLFYEKVFVAWSISTALFVVLLIWLLPKLWRGIKSVFSAIGRLFGGGKREPEPDQDLSDPERKQ